MRSLLKLFPVLICLGLGATAVVAEKKDEVKAESKKKDKKDKEKVKDEKEEGKKDNAKGEDERDKTLSLPIPKDRPQKGVVIPLHDANGKLRMHFTIGVATWVSAENINMETLSVQTYKDDGEKELDMEFPDAVMNVKTKEISTDTHVTIRRDDFEISGNKMTYNTETKLGKLSKGVKMLIYNIKSDSGDEKKDGAKKKLSVDIAPKPLEKKP